MECQWRGAILLAMIQIMMQSVTIMYARMLGDEVYSPGSGCEDCPEEANQCINDRLCCELYSYACNVDI